jgi:DNA topoisomerase IA
MNEAGLIALMQVGGIGRPSTYAIVIKGLLTRKYIQREPNHALIVTEHGRTVLGFLLREYPDLFSLEFSAKMERQLDEIASSRKSYVRVLGLLQENLD